MALFQTSPKGLHIDTQPPRGFYLPYVYIIFIQYLIHDYTTYKLFFLLYTCMQEQDHGTSKILIN